MNSERDTGSSLETRDIWKTVREEHRHIMALYQLYLNAAADSRHAIVNQIFHALALHLQKEEELLYADIGNGSEQGRRLVEEALLEHEEIKAMMSEVEQSETDDDQALDEFFEDMMQTVRLHFVAEERDMFPFVDAGPPGQQASSSPQASAT